MGGQSCYFWADKVTDWAYNNRKSSIGQTKSLFWVNEVASWAHNDRKSPIRQTKSPTGRTKSPVKWTQQRSQLGRQSHYFEQTKLPVKRKERSPLGRKLKLSWRQKLSYLLSSFFLLACFVHAFFVVAQGTSNVLVKDTCGGIIPPLYRSPHWEALALSLGRDLFAYLSTFLIATSFFCVGGNGAFNNTQAKNNNTTVASPSLPLFALSP